MATHEAMGGPEAEAGPAAVALSWPLPGCHPESLGDLFSTRALAELARVAGAAGGAAQLDLCGHVLQAPAGGRPGQLHLLKSKAPPAGLRSLALRNGTLVLRPGVGLAFVSIQPFTVSMERVKVTRPAPTSGSGSPSGKAQHAPDAEAGRSMVAFSGAVSGLMRACRLELSPAGPAGSSMRQMSAGVHAARHAAPPPGVPHPPTRHPACRPAARHAAPPTRHPARRPARRPAAQRAAPPPGMTPCVPPRHPACRPALQVCTQPLAPTWCLRTWTWWAARAPAPVSRSRALQPTARGSS
jgi:hypothetical protein